MNTHRTYSHGADFVERRAADGHSSLAACSAAAVAYYYDRVREYGDDAVGHLPISLDMEDRSRDDYLAELEAGGFRVLTLPD